MRAFCLAAILAAILAATGALAAGGDPTAIRIEPQNRALRGSGASQQFLLIGSYADGTERDLTETARWELSDRTLAALNATGTLSAQKNGLLTVIARMGDKAAQAKVNIAAVSETREFQFTQDIGGILTRQGCNGSACHGGVKGRGGFKLSSGALHPKEDYEWIVKGGTYQVLTAEAAGSRTPRIDVSNPEKSLLLLKATASVAHGGGQRIVKDAAEYRSLLQWIRDGAPFGPENDRKNEVTKLEVFPPVVTMERNAKHRLLVTAHFADGRTEDFTLQALYSSNDKEIAKVDQSGQVSPGRLGETAILVRAAGKRSPRLLV